MSYVALEFGSELFPRKYLGWLRQLHGRQMPGSQVFHLEQADWARREAGTLAAHLDISAQASSCGVFLLVSHAESSCLRLTLSDSGVVLSGRIDHMCAAKMIAYIFMAHLPTYSIWSWILVVFIWGSFLGEACPSYGQKSGLHAGDSDLANLLAFRYNEKLIKNIVFLLRNNTCGWWNYIPSIPRKVRRILWIYVINKASSLQNSETTPITMENVQRTSPLASWYHMDQFDYNEIVLQNIHAFLYWLRPKLPRFSISLWPASKKL